MDSGWFGFGRCPVVVRILEFILLSRGLGSWQLASGLMVNVIRVRSIYAN